ncbi:MAG: hypothetical protein FWC42_04715 [Proteobacteria bacterium]|nr:hypothetical protein [Pseudomonadota bacterium]
MADFIPKWSAEPKAIEERKKRAFRIALVSFAIALLISLFLLFVLRLALFFCFIPFLAVGVFLVIYYAVYSDDPPCLW